MFLIFVNYAERYNLSQVLSAAPVKGTEFTMLSLKDAGIDKKISTRTRMYIYEEKSKLVESFLESKYFCPDLSSKKNLNTYLGHYICKRCFGHILNTRPVYIW